MALEPDLTTPDATMVNRRWVRMRDVDWARTADNIMVEHGMVQGSVVYDDRHHARWRAQKLIKLMVRLDLHERWELKEHAERKDGGWIWSVEYLRRRK